ncbi:MAG: AbrB/MazE/SpoVT family DNA-binding domain-containing protein [Elusimicrobia bacterium]|nr:AbrB/MazE/SpoVT family DNA-binding domain-containing protein [Elusimicrobiota bacterium]
MTITIDKAGRVVIPKSLREALHISPGDSLQVDSSAEAITLRPIQETAALRKENGFWVYRTGRRADISIPELIDEDRARRGGQGGR